jgi:hypothetical protein
MLRKEFEHWVYQEYHSHSESSDYEEMEFLIVKIISSLIIDAEDMVLDSRYPVNNPV